MLMLRDDQLQIFRGRAESDPDLRLAEGVRDRFRADYELIGGEGPVLVAVRAARERARGLGFTSEDQLRRYLDMTLTLGSEFHRDPAIPWTAEALDPRRRRDPDARLARLHEATMDFLERTTGADGKHFRAALLRARRLEWERLDGADLSAVALRGEQRALLEEVYPEKAGELDDDDWDDYLEALEEEPWQRSARSRPERLVNTLLAFLLGIGFASDPLQPWAGRVRSELDEMEPNDAGRALYRRAKAQIDRAIDQMRAVGI